eukprot:scaffold59250_cov63-Phaeocystis_antarctica.AAC.2
MPSSLACSAERWCASSTTKCSVCSRATVASDTCTRPVAPISSIDMAPAMPLPHMSKWNLTVPARGEAAVHADPRTHAQPARGRLCRDRRDHLDGELHDGLLWLGARRERAGAHHVGIADGLDLVCAKLVGELVESLEELRDKVDHLLGRVVLRQLCEADQVTLQHSHLLVARDLAHGALRDLLHDRRGERVEQQVVRARAHAGLQVDDLVGEACRPIVVARLPVVMVRDEDADDLGGEHLGELRAKQQARGVVAPLPPEAEEERE